MLYHGYVLDSS